MKNACIFLITEDNRVLLIRERDDKTWNIPGGKVEKGESSFEGARREFFEETGFLLDVSKINNIIRHNFYKKNSKTSIFIIKTNQKFSTYNPTLETDKIYYIKIEDLTKSIKGYKLHHTVNSFRDYFINSFIEMDNKHLFII
jgi:8-oxo-dGTP pyrophosphatase MutT (NUDIX family)